MGGIGHTHDLAITAGHSDDTALDGGGARRAVVAVECDSPVGNGVHDDPSA
jgi:hypothetical protein